jgi:hypothetical protein
VAVIHPVRTKAGAQRIVLIGTPERLTGIVRVTNPGTEKLKIKTAVVYLKQGSGAPVPLTIDARLTAGETAHAPASLALDPRTPPGELHGEVVFGDEARDVVIKVLERRALAVIPGHFQLHGVPGDSVRVPVSITNLGNVPLELPRVALVSLGQANAFEQLFHVAVARKGAEGHQPALDAFAQLLSGSEVEAPKVRLGKGAGQALAPGESLESEITFKLPAKLARHRIYQGSFFIGREQCTVEIEVDPPPAEDGPPPGEPTTVTKSRK